MNKTVLILILGSCSSFPAFSQWAVLDEEARKLLEKINNVESIGNKQLEKIDFATQKKLSATFESVVVANPECNRGQVLQCNIFASS